ncbi:hypothetical protein ES703_88830 [subsurface metagenome]
MELRLEITEELDQELKEFADAQLVTKEDIARGIIANSFVKAKQQKEQKPSFFGFDLAAVGQALTAVGAQILAAQEKKE